MNRPHVVVLGDCLLDRDVIGHVERVCPDAPVPVVDVDRVWARPGGAGLSAVLATQDGVDVTLVAPLAGDEDGHQLRELLAGCGVRLLALDHEGATRVKTRVRAGAQSVARLDTGGPGRPGNGLTPEAADAVAGAAVVLVSCYGAGTTVDPTVRRALGDRAVRRPVVWDPHPRGGEPVEGCALVTPNLLEARRRTGMEQAEGDEVALTLLRMWAARAVSVTAGPRGAWLATTASEPMLAPATAASGDPCGAGDRFSAAISAALARGATASEAVVDAVAKASAFVRDDGVAGLAWPTSDDDGSDSSRAPGSSGAALRPRGTPFRLVTAASDPVTRTLRRGGGTLVATGGCFDVLHAGHVALLEAARSLGDRLVVLLNSDASVRRLKGAGRPVNTQADRIRVLSGLSCVDSVVVFDEDDPRRALARLRPAIWAKGGDYEDADLPEAGLVRSWGGRVVLLPYLSGRSTTAILHSTTRGDNP
jgi:rfaE bifunctional protein nucleotidyltransferase chain/domain/rfaE bifunctional protein kinase chain/domain